MKREKIISLIRLCQQHKPNFLDARRLKDSKVSSALTVSLVPFPFPPTLINIIFMGRWVQGAPCIIAAALLS